MSALLLGLAALTGCAQELPPDAGLDARVTLDAGIADGSLSDAQAPTDAQGPEDARAADVPPPTALPLSRADLTTVSATGAIDVASTILPDGDGALVVFERYDADFTRGELWSLRWRPAGGFGAPALLSVGTQAMVGSPSLLEAGGRRWLYYLQAPGVQGAASLSRVELLGGGFAAPEAVALPGASWGLLSWPRVYRDPTAGLAAAYRNHQSRPEIAGSADGLAFGTGRLVAPEGHALPALAFFGDGTRAYTYQVQGGPEPMVSFVRRSLDGEAWSEPNRVTESSSNVHDTCAAPRSDGGLDLYYIYPAGGPGFSLFRRALSPEGRLGPEEMVSAPAAGDLSKPQVQRLPDGRYLVLFAEITARAPQGFPSEQRLGGVALWGEAPPP